MSDLLDRTIEAHGGLERWRGVRAIDVVFNFSGGLLDLKGFPGHHRPAASVDALKPRAVLQRLSGDPDDNNLINANGAFSMPCSTVSFHVTLPSCIHADIRFRNSCMRSRWGETLKPSNRMLLPTVHDIAWPRRQCGGVVLRNHPAKREAGERVCCGKRGLKVLAANIVKINVDSVRSRSKQGFSEVVHCFIIDYTVDADVFEERAFSCAARRSNDRVPFYLGDLTCDGSYCAGSGRHKHYVARLQGRDLR